MHAVLQDALVGATDKKNSQHEKDGELFYDYEVVGAVSRVRVNVWKCSLLFWCFFAVCSCSAQPDEQQLSCDTYQVCRCNMQDLHYLASITLKSGKVFALFVKSPTKVTSDMYLLLLKMSTSHAAVLLQSAMTLMLTCDYAAELCSRQRQA